MRFGFLLIGQFLPVLSVRAQPTPQSIKLWKPWKPGADSRSRPAKRALRGGPTGGFRTDVPAHLYDVILGRPTRDSVTVSLLSCQKAEAKICHGTTPGVYTHETSILALVAGAVAEIEVADLQPNTRHYYRVDYQPNGGGEPLHGPERTFHTQRSADSPFTFTIQADSHLDENTETQIYGQTLRNVATDGPDFPIDLGDTFMTGKYGRRHEDALPQYLAQRYYLGLVSHSAPLFLVLGNHDGETGGKTTAAIRMRTTYFPNPFPDGFYTGSPERVEGVGPAQNYYAWEWGSALFIVLDPFGHTVEQRGRRKADNWGRTLGREQYDWLQTTLEQSNALFKFVFIHHLVGGLDRNARGGAEAARFYEWGGRDLDGSDTFRQHRPGWPMPIHGLLVREGVSIVFHGHDHFCARQELDGITYQLVPQPGHAGTKTPRYAASYGYRSGDIMGGSGHLRVHVGKGEAKVDYIQAGLPRHDTSPSANGDVAFSYAVSPSFISH